MSSDLLVEESVCQWLDCSKQLPPVSDLCILGGCLQKVHLSYYFTWVLLLEFFQQQGHQESLLCPSH